MRWLRAVLAGAVVTLATSGALFGQGFQGGLRGSIKDAGGVIPGVEVTLTNEQTNIKRSTTTNERGEFVFANVDPGTYKLTATLQGYKTIDRGEVRIGTQQFFTLDLTMEVGQIQESVTVTGQAPLIETTQHHEPGELQSSKPDRLFGEHDQSLGGQNHEHNHEFSPDSIGAETDVLMRTRSGRR